MKKVLLEDLIKLGVPKTKGYLIENQKFYETEFSDLDLSYFEFNNCEFHSCCFTRVNAYLSRWINCIFNKDIYSPAVYVQTFGSQYNSHNSFILAYFKSCIMGDYAWAFSSFQGSDWQSYLSNVTFTQVNFSDSFFTILGSYNKEANTNIKFNKCDFSNLKIEKKEFAHNDNPISFETWDFNVYGSNIYTDTYANGEISLQKNVFNDTIFINNESFNRKELLKGLRRADKQEQLAFPSVEGEGKLMYSQYHIEQLMKEFTKSPVYKLAINKFLDFMTNSIDAEPYLNFTNLLIKHHKTIIKFIKGTLK